MANRKESIIPISLITLTALSGLVLSSPASHADSTGTVTLTVDVPASCSLTVNPSSHTVTINPGNTGLIGTSTIKSICNDPAGLAVYAVGYTNDTYGNNNLSSTVGASTINIATSVTPSGTPSTSEWYMTLSAISGDYTPTITTGFDSAHIIPDVYTKVAYRNTMTDIGTNATGAQFTASFNAYIAPTQAAGTYEGKVKFLLVHPNVLTYNDQTGEPATVQPATLACEPAEYDTFDPSVTHYLQDVAQWKNQVALEQEVTAIDRRDGQSYKVKRFKTDTDGCQTTLWMSNLNLGAEPLASGVTQLDSTNTNLDPSDTPISKSTFESWIKTSGSNSYTSPELIPITASNSATNSATDAYGNKYGTLYNFAAASAGTFAYPAEDDAAFSNATSDICPSGWRLPTANSDDYTGELFNQPVRGYNLYDASSYGLVAGGLEFMQENLGFALAGNAISSAPRYQGFMGIYWSSTHYGEGSSMDVLYFNTYDDLSGTGEFYNRGNNYSIRCITK